MKKIAIKICIFLLTAFIALSGNNFVSAVSSYHHVRELKTGDVIYFDNSATNWSSVRIYLFSSHGGAERFSWNSRPYMQRVNGNIYKYELTSDLNIESYKDNQLIFSNDSGNQTIDLGFIETGYAYIATSNGGSKSYRGYWYVYDKSDLIELVNNTKRDIAIAENCLDGLSVFDELKNLIAEAETVINSESRVGTDANATSNDYYTDVDESIENINNKIEEIKSVYNYYPNICILEPEISITITNPKANYRIGDTVYFEITVTNTADVAIYAKIDKVLEGFEFLPGTGYSIGSTSSVDCQNLAAGDSVTIYGKYEVDTDTTAHLVNLVSIANAASDSDDGNYSLNPDKDYTDTVEFDTQSWQDIPVATGIEMNNTLVYIVLSLVGICGIGSTVLFNKRNH